jgi:hypothetical protein
VDCNHGVDEIAVQLGQRALFVRARKPAVADNVSDDDCRDFPPFGQAALPAPIIKSNLANLSRAMVIQIK